MMQPETAIKQLSEQKDKLNNLNETNYKAWMAQTKYIIKELFGEQSEFYGGEYYAK